MKAVVCANFEGPSGLALADVTPPRPAADEVRIAVHAASLNYIDILIAHGRYQVRPDLPYVVGAEAAGEVVEVGAEVQGLAVGDRVASFHLTGGFAEEMVGKGYRTIQLPDAVDYTTGAAILHNYVTAAYALRERARLAPGETLLVHGATGGVGLAALDVGRHLGATLIAGVGSASKAELAVRYGAAHVIDYGREDITERVKALTQGRGADVVFDPVGGEVFEKSLRAVAWDGRLLVIGFAGGAIASVPTNLPLLKSCAIVGVNTGAWPEHAPAAFGRLARTIMAWVEAGAVTPHIAEVLPLDRFGDAMAAMEERRAVGRTVFTVR